MNTLLKRKENGRSSYDINRQTTEELHVEDRSDSKVGDLHKEIIIYKNELKQMAEVNSSLKEALRERGGSSGSISQHLTDGLIERMESELRSYKRSIVPDLKQQIDTLSSMLGEREEQLESLKLSYSILEDKYKMEKYKVEYVAPSRRSRIEELEDNLRVFKRDSDLSRQRLERERQTLHYNKSDISRGSQSRSRNHSNNRLYQQHGTLRDVRIMPQDAYYVRDRPIAYASQPLLEQQPNNEEISLR